LGYSSFVQSILLFRGVAKDFDAVIMVGRKEIKKLSGFTDNTTRMMKASFEDCWYLVRVTNFQELGSVILFPCRLGSRTVCGRGAFLEVGNDVE
jgi:hypothetical protein